MDGEVNVSVTLTNRGAQAGSEVAQLYVRDKVASLVRPVQELKAFGRVSLAPGACARLTFRVPVDMLNFTNREGARIVEPGEFEIYIGANSGDIRRRGLITVEGDTRELGNNWRMLSSCNIEQ
ncbi:Beta-xylosidase [Cronobacter condimenti 1330]|nr:Beta-xylosidase [Cronobacter condimenti 1330]